jgi:hypothetical protein
MKHLRSEAFERARHFLNTQARPLERALFAHRFEGAPLSGVPVELARFQNQDGGFGHALEPDLRTPSSSALATGIGLRLLAELGCAASHPMVEQAVAYLLSTFDEQARVWRVVPADTHSYPHAPWWHDEDGRLARVFDDFRVIPRALIAGLLHHYSALVPTRWLDAITAETVQYIDNVEVLATGGGSDLEYTVYLAEAENLPPRHAARLKARIQEDLPALVVRDPARWDSYCITPLRAVRSPQSLGAELIQDELQMHLDYQIAHQTLEGTWDPTWTWRGAYPEAWAQARLEWRGHLTLETLTQLRAFGRMPWGVVGS